MTETIVLRNKSNMAHIIKGIKVLKRRLVTVPRDTEYDKGVFELVNEEKKELKSKPNKKINLEDDKI